MPAVPFITSFIASLFALSLHLPQGGVPVSNLKGLSNQEALILTNKICLSLIKNVLQHEVTNLDQTLKPLIDRAHHQKDTDLGNDFLGKYSMPEILESISTLCSTSFDVNADIIRSIDIQAGIKYYLEILESLPPVSKLANINAVQSSKAYALDNTYLGPVNSKNSVSKLIAKNKEISDLLKQAFVSAEDKNFYEHSGVELSSLLKAFLNSGAGEQVYGGSTITQQLVKNTLLNYDRTLERKIKEFILAKQVTENFSKDETLLMYLNFIYFGRSSNGVKAAAIAYFNKNLNSLSLSEIAFLASLPQNPSNFDPQNNYDSIINRRNKVLDRMQSNGYISKSEYEKAIEEKIEFLPSFISDSSMLSNYFLAGVDGQLNKLSSQGIIDKSNSYFIKTTYNFDIQKPLTTSLQKELIKYEKFKRKTYSQWNKEAIVQVNIHDKITDLEKKLTTSRENSEALQRQENKNRNALSKLKGKKSQNLNPENDQTANVKTNKDNPLIWNKVLRSIPHIFADTNWLKAVVLSIGENTQIGLDSGEITILNNERNGIKWTGRLAVGDVIYVENVIDVKKDSKYYFLRKPTEVQGAAIVLDIKSGAILAMVGGFSFQSSEWNRAIFAERQPGSTLKPFSYLAALDQNMQPNYLLYDGPLSFKPIKKGGKWWRPSNGYAPTNDWKSLRIGLETSNNYMTSFLLNVLGTTPKDSLDLIRGYAQAFGIYKEPWDHTLSFVLGAQKTSLINLTAAYAQLGNGGVQNKPFAIQEVRIESANGPLVYKNDASEYSHKNISDSVSLFQLQTMLQGVTHHGTAKVLKKHSHYIAGKTGTTNKSNDAWFIGYTPKIAIGVWIGYDNKSNKTKKYLGKGSSGGTLAAPVVKSFLESNAVWAMHEGGSIKLPDYVDGIETEYFNHNLGIFSDENDNDALKEYFRIGAWKHNYQDTAMGWFINNYQDQPSNSEFEDSNKLNNDEDSNNANYNLIDGWGMDPFSSPKQMGIEEIF